MRIHRRTTAEPRGLSRPAAAGPASLQTNAFCTQRRPTLPARAVSRLAQIGNTMAERTPVLENSGWESSGNHRGCGRGLASAGRLPHTIARSS
eukprot:2037554-Rhodomonas_salina.1